MFYPYDFPFFFCGHVGSERPKTRLQTSWTLRSITILISFWTKQFNNNNGIDV